MRVNEYVTLFRNCGLKINQSGDHYFNQQGMINYSFPQLFKIQVNRKLVNSIKWKYLISILLTELRKKNTHEFVLQTDNYSIEGFSKKIRNRIRKSLQNCTFKRPSLDDLLTHGLAINQQTFKRQQRKDKFLTDLKYWNKYISSLFSQDNINILSAYYAGRMVGYIIAAELEEKYVIFHAFIDRNDSEITDPMNGLLYTMINQLIEKNRSVIISYGLDSFLDLSELNRFKSNMLFKRIPVSRIYIINPLLVPFIQFLIFIILRVFKRRNIRNIFARKLIRLYHGHRLWIEESTSED